MSQNEKNKIIKKKDLLCEIIDKSRSFQEQIKSLEKKEDLEEYCLMKDYDDKDLKSKVFKLKLSHLSNIIGEKYLSRYLVIHL